MSNGVFPFSEPVLVTYIDLDKLIASANLTKAERKVVNWLMRGHDFEDIADHCRTESNHVKLIFKHAVDKITKMRGI